MSQIQTFDHGTALADVETLTGNSGGAVGPNGAGNINVLGADNITVTGNPGTNTLTITDTDNTIYTAQTIGNVTATIFTYAIPAESAVFIGAQVVGAKDDYTEVFGGPISCVARRDAVGAPEIPWQDDATDGDDLEPDTFFGVSGNNIILTVLGATGDTYNWRAKVTYIVQDV